MLYTKSPTEIEEIFQTNIKDGLSVEEASARLAKNGRNEIIAKKGKTYAQMFLDQITEPLIYVLLAAMVICFFLKEYSDCVIILAVILINAIIGVIQEGKAKAALDALKKMSTPNCLVRRSGQVLEIPAPELVVGDIVLLEAGRQVPADIRLTSAINLKIDEAALTGESLPVEKNNDIIVANDGKNIPLGDRTNMAFMTTNVTYGRGEGIVVAASMATEIGTIAKMINDAEESATPLQKRLADMGKMLGILTVALCLLLMVIAIIQGRDIVEMLISAIALAVAAVPEGLPAVVTIVLAMGVQRLVKVNTIVKRLPSVETLGSVNIVCSDKTGTLTQNKMTITRWWALDDTSMREGGNVADEAIQTSKDDIQLTTNNYQLPTELLTGFILCNDASIAQNGDRIGDPTELAFLDLGLQYNITKEALNSQFPRVSELAFNSDRKMMTTLHSIPGGNIVGEGLAPPAFEAQHSPNTYPLTPNPYIAYTKGAPDEVLKCCSNITPENFEAIYNKISEWSSQALRVLALAKRTYNSPPSLEETSLEFIGLMAMIDPPRPEAKAAVETFKNAGVTTVMITGDHKDTAFAIARELGIAQSIDQCITGEELDNLENITDILTKRVFARVSPEHKVIIVKTFKSAGNIVSMTGDGVNDAPSLKNADIGVAMGITGTDVAKGAADIILTDDNFATIEKAIEEGRGIYANIKKTVVFLLSSNFGEIFTMIVGILFGVIPLQATQILWINLITDSLPALALGVDENDGKSIMKQQPRRPTESLWAHGALALTITYGIIIGAITLWAFRIGLKISPDTAKTYAFTTLAVAQLFHAIGMRDINKSIFKMNHTRNKMMLIAFTIGLMFQLAVTEIPFLNNVFHTTHLTLIEWVMLIAIAIIPLAFHEIIILWNFIKGKNRA